MDGKLERSYEVHCAGCAGYFQCMGRLRAAAAQELRAHGWATRDRLWFCPECLTKARA